MEKGWAKNAASTIQQHYQGQQGDSGAQSGNIGDTKRVQHIISQLAENGAKAEDLYRRLCAMHDRIFNDPPVPNAGSVPGDPPLPIAFADVLSTVSLRQDTLLTKCHDIVSSLERFA